MRAVRVVDGSVQVVDLPEPEGPLVLPVRVASICGTDLGFIAMGLGGWTPGHEFAVARAGVTYAVEPTSSCGVCDECVHGTDNRCTGEHENIGIFRDGGLAERVALAHERQLIPLPAGLDAGDACLVEPTAVAWRGLNQARIEVGERVCVVGGGSIGLLAGAAAKAHGHDVDLESRHRHQREAGERLGLGLPAWDYDVVIDAAGSESGLARCLELVRPGGRVVLLGVYLGLVPVPGVPLLLKEAVLVPSMAYAVDEHGTREFARAASFLAANPIVASTVITHRFGLEEAPEAFRVAGDRSSGAIKVVIEVG